MQLATVERPRADLGVLVGESYRGVAPFDLYDSSHKGFSEAYRADLDGSHYTDLQDRFQYRFIERRRTRRGRPREPLDFRVRLAESNRKMREFFRGDGTFDFDSYARSDSCYERDMLIDENVRRVVVRDMNHDIDVEFERSLRDFKITHYALEKANYLARRVSELSASAGKGEHQEAGMTLLLDRGHAVGDGETVTDISLSSDQIVGGGLHEVTAMGELDPLEVRLGKVPYGWAHSHGAHPTYFSTIDDPTMQRAVRCHCPIIRVRSYLDVLSPIYYVPALVVNDRGDEPAYGIIARKPRFYIENGAIKTTEDTVYLKRVPSRENPFYKDNWPIPVMVDDGKQLTADEKAALDRKIICSIRFFDGTKLSDYYPSEGVSQVAHVTAGEGNGTKVNTPTKSTTYSSVDCSIEDRIKQRIRQEVIRGKKEAVGLNVETDVKTTSASDGGISARIQSWRATIRHCWGSIMSCWGQ